MTDFESLWESAPDGLVRVDQGGVIRLVNHQMELLFGYERREMVGQLIETLVPKSFGTVQQGPGEGPLADPGGARATGAVVELSGLRRDGTEFPADISVSWIETTDGPMVTAAVRDVTDRKRQSQDLQPAAATIQNSEDEDGAVIAASTIARDVTQARQAFESARTMIESSLDALVAISPQGMITDVNEATVKITGIPRVDLIGTAFSECFTDPEKANAIYQLVFDQGMAVDYPLTVRHQDGTLTEVLYNASVYRDADGEVIVVFAAARDVTEARQAFESARSMIESSLDALVAISPQGMITDVNEATVKITGIPRVDLIGTAFSECFTDPEGANAIYQLVFEQGMAVDYPLTMIHTDGTLTEVLYNASVYRDAGGKVLGVFAAARDVTKQRQAGARYTRSLLEAALDPLVTISPQGKITDVNEATVKITGVHREDLIGTAFSDYFTDPDRANEGYQLVFDQGSVTDYPMTMRHRSGTLTEVLYNASVYLDAGGQVLGVFAAARDVTEQNRAQAEIAHQAKELNRLAELERFQRLTVGRELKMIELKKEIEILRRLGPGDADLQASAN